MADHKYVTRASTGSAGSTSTAATQAALSNLKMTLLSMLWSGEEMTLRTVEEQLTAMNNNTLVADSETIADVLDLLISDNFVTVVRRSRGHHKEAEECYRIRSAANTPTKAAAAATSSSPNNVPVTATATNNDGAGSGGGRGMSAWSPPASTTAAASAASLSSPNKQHHHLHQQHHNANANGTGGSGGGGVDGGGVRSVVQTELDDFLREHFKGCFDEKLDCIDVYACASQSNMAPEAMLQAMKELFLQCKRNTLSGCWRLANPQPSATSSNNNNNNNNNNNGANNSGAVSNNSNAAPYQTVLKWKSVHPSATKFKRLFVHPTAGNATHGHNALLARHDPRRCEFFFGNEHRMCCRPSHIAWGTTDDNIRDRQLAVHLRSTLGPKFKEMIDAESRVWLEHYHEKRKVELQHFYGTHSASGAPASAAAAAAPHPPIASHQSSLIAHNQSASATSPHISRIHPHHSTDGEQPFQSTATASVTTSTSSPSKQRRQHASPQHNPSQSPSSASSASATRHHAYAKLTVSTPFTPSK